MKKVIALVLAAIMALGFVGCSSPSKEYSIGETASNDSMEFTLDRVEFADTLGNVVDENYMLPNGRTYGANPNSAKNGKTLLSVSFSIKNTGKEEIKLINKFLDVIYDDGYTYTSNDINSQDFYFLYNDANKSEWARPYPYSESIQPLEKREYRGYIEVPKEVSENKEKSLIIRISSRGISETHRDIFTYKIR